VVFGEKHSASGAVPGAARRLGDSVEITLADFEGDLDVYSARDPSAFELCGAAAGSCQFAAAQLEGGGRIRIDATGMSAATRVRYCWADSPLCNLFDSAGMPVGPFEIAID
jgi:sialate O-acetylesterase